MHAETPEAVYGIARISSSSCTAPSSPSRPCRATNATSGAACSRRCTRSPPTSIAGAWGPSRSSASSTRAPDLSDTCRSSERPPLSTATRLIARRLCVSTPTGSLLVRARRPLPCRAPLRQRDDVGELAGRARLRLGQCVGRRRRPGAGQRAVEADLLAHGLADATDPLAGLLLADAGEVQPH